MFIFAILDLIFGSILTYFLVAIIIYALKGVIEYVSNWLTLHENHRVESDFQNALISKVFIYEFINSYGMLFYIAFFRSMWGSDCDSSNGSCMGELSLAFFIIFAFRTIVGNA